jgi:hypothetical protein
MGKARVWGSLGGRAERTEEAGITLSECDRLGSCWVDLSGDGKDAQRSPHSGVTPRDTGGGLCSLSSGRRAYGHRSLLRSHLRSQGTGGAENLGFTPAHVHVCQGEGLWLRGL